ncbi:MAG: two-component sensor histidine kinase [Clostridiaceae bacterium]|nr:two-component sensor histidine kinase [Clostridiaceae bacterium]
MENWFVINKLMILIYISYRLVNINVSYSANMLQVVLFLLFFVVLNMSKAIVQGRRYKLMFVFISVLELLFCCFFIDLAFIFLIPINIFELILHRLKWRYIFFVLALSTFLLNMNSLAEFIIISGLNFTGFYFVLNKENRINKLLKANESLKEKNNELTVDLDNQILFKHQIIYTSQLEERNKIAQEIHDKLGHSISGSLMQLEAAKLIMDIDSIKSKDIIGNTINVLRDGMESIRNTLKNIKPDQEQLGINKIKLLVKEFKNNGQINVGLFHSDNLDRISFLEWKVIYENIKEALTNIFKYSKAKNVKVDIKVLNKLIKIEIKDDGQGCNKIIKGLGLSGIEERTMNLNGKLIIDGSNGFSVIVLLPIESE